MAKKDNPWDNDGVWNSVSDEVRKFKVLNGGASNNWGGYVKYGFLLLLVLWVCSGFYQVQPSEAGVVLRFGKYVDT
ncbi:MAG: protease modulator HflK, partial [Alphaproteobacteria bacterium]|nr:protease modulator HflK [Alphaproteobacteria bacterium]